MKRKVVFMFSGQGSQYYNMGGELYQNNPRFAAWLDHCDDLVWDTLEESIVEELFQPDKKSQPFDKLRFTNPSLISTQYALAQVLMEMGVKPDLLLGYSLGEFTASIVSGALSLEEGLRFMTEGAKLIETQASIAPMLAIINSTDLMQQHPELFQNCWRTGTNFDQNFVVSGLATEISRIQKALMDKEIICQQLPVNYGFHTQLMDPIEQDFKALANEVTIGDIQIPTYSSLTTGQIDSVNSDYFWRVLRETVEFQTTIKNMIAKDDYIFIDVGPSGTLAMFAKYNLPRDSNSVYLEMINQFGKDLQSFDKMESALHQWGCLS